jgi:hypothetical protein
MISHFSYQVEESQLTKDFDVVDAGALKRYKPVTQQIQKLKDYPALYIIPMYMFCVLYMRVIFLHACTIYMFYRKLKSMQLRNCMDSFGYFKFVYAKLK